MTPILSFILAHPGRIAQLLVLALVVRATWSIIYNIFFHPIAHIKGPLLAKISPLYKISWELSSSRVLAVERLLRQYGSPVRIGPNELAFSDEQSYVDIYGQRSNPCPKSPQYDLFSSTADGNLISTRDRKEHARLRRYFSPALSSQGLRASEGQLMEKIDWFMQHVMTPAATSGLPLEMYERLYSLNLDIISLLSFGKSLDTLKGDNKTALHGVKSFTTVIPLTVMVPFLRYLPIDFIREGFRGLRELESLTRACLVAYKARIENEDVEKETRSLVYNLVTAADPEAGGATLTLEELVANTIVFLVGGTDTTTITVCYALWELGRRPETRAKLRKELLAAFPDPNIAPTYDVTSKLPYLNCVITETLRLWGPLSTARAMRVSPGCVLGNAFIPAGVEVCTNMYAAARDPRVYADAEDFIPERWLDATAQMKNMSRPFSLGPAACIGKPLAEMNLSLLIARVYQLFDVTVDASMTDDMMNTKDKGILHPRDEKLVIRVVKG